MNSFSALFAPGYIGKIKVKNRVVMAPMATNLATVNGEITDTLVNYYRARACGGVGLIIIEAACVDSPVGREGFCQINIDHPMFLAGLQRLTEEIKACGSRVFIQLFHAGRQTSSFINGGLTPVAPSPIPCPMMKEVPLQLEISEIKQIINKFIISAQYACTAGFDGVELHAAHGYLINQFLSPHSNHRQDEYGGSLPNRMRFLMEIVAGIKKILPYFPVSVRLNIDDFVSEGLGLEESLQICRELESMGVDIINCSSGTYESGLKSIEPASYEQGWRVYLAEAVKKVVDIPVITGGLIQEPVYANQVIENGQADFIFLGRSLLADPQWPNKARQGNTLGIRPCICCNNCIGNNFKGLGVRCTVNPYTGRENMNHDRATLGKARRAIIVGGGPAGMQAALSLKQYNVDVSLYEKGANLGGFMTPAGLPPAKDRILALRDYLVREVYKAGIDVLLNQEFNLDELENSNADIVVLATGSRPTRPAIKGNYLANCVDATDILLGNTDLSAHAIVVIGGGSTGCEAADYLLTREKRVTLVEKEAMLAMDMEKKNRRDLLNRLQKLGVVKITDAQVEEVVPAGVWIRNSTGEKELLPADLVVWATGFKQQNELYTHLINKVPHVFVIGDAADVRGFRDAILEGETLGRIINQLPF